MPFQEVKIYRSRLWPLLVIVPLTAIFLMMAPQFFKDLQVHEVDTRGIAGEWIFLLGIPLMLISPVRALLDARPEIEVLHEGVLIPSFSPDVIAWRGITGIHGYRRKLAGFVALKISPEVMQGLHLKKHRILVAVGRKSVIDEATFPTVYLNYGPTQLAEFLKACQAAVAASASQSDPTRGV